MEKMLNHPLAAEAREPIVPRLEPVPDQSVPSVLPAAAASVIPAVAAKLVRSERDPNATIDELGPAVRQDVIDPAGLPRSFRASDIEEGSCREPLELVVQRTEAHLGAARAQWERAAELSPETGIYHYHLARCLIELGELDPAVDRLARAIELEPKNPDAYIALAQITGILQKADDARKILELGLEQMPGHPQLMMELTKASFVAEDLEVGLKAAADLAARTPDDPIAQNNHALHLLAHGRFKDVVELCTSLRDRGIISAQLSCSLADAYEALGDVANAIAVCTEAVAQDPDDWQAPNSLALLILQSADDHVVPEAIEFLKEANRRDPDQIEPLLNLALAYARINEPGKALDLARVAASRLSAEHPLKEQADRVVAALSPVGPTALHDVTPCTREPASLLDPQRR